MKRLCSSLIAAAFATVVPSYLGAQTWTFDPSRVYDPIEKSMLSGKRTELSTSALVCESRQDIDNVIIQGGMYPALLEAQMISEGKCVRARAGANVRLRAILGWANAHGIFYCELKVDYYGPKMTPPDPKFSYIAKVTYSPFLQQECGKYFWT